jgi:putative ABC transport system ATP-binding protein
MNVIKLEGLSKTFTDRAEPTVALTDINLTVQQGEFVAIIGPSGSGKSTLMNIIGLLDSPSDGRYLLDGQDVSNLSDSKLSSVRRDKIGFIFQSFNLLPRLTVQGNVELPLVYAGVRGRKRHERALELLDLVGLKDRAGYRPNQISGGQTQRVAIARALAIPKPSPETPVLMGRPVALVSVALEGVPRAGVVSVGESGRVECCGILSFLVEPETDRVFGYGFHAMYSIAHLCIYKI